MPWASVVDGSSFRSAVRRTTSSRSVELVFLYQELDEGPPGGQGSGRAAVAEGPPRHILGNICCQELTCFGNYSNII